MARALGLSLGCGVRRALSSPPGGCSAVGEGALCMDGRRPPRAAPLGVRRPAPDARCDLPGVGGRVRCCPGCVPPSTSPLRASATLSVPLPPTPLPGCARRLSAPPPPQDARGARPGAALAAGRAEGVGRAGGGGRGRGAGARASSPRWRDGERRRLGGRGRDGVWSWRRGRRLKAGAPKWGLG